MAHVTKQNVGHHPLNEGEMANEVAGLLWNHMQANGWKSVEAYNFGEVVIVADDGTTYRLGVTIDQPGEGDAE